MSRTIICSKILLDGITHEQGVISRSRGGLLANVKEENLSNDSKGRTIRKVIGGGGGGTKKNSCKGKCQEKNSCKRE